MIYLFPRCLQNQAQWRQPGPPQPLVDDAAAFNDYLTARGVAAAAPHPARVGDLIMGVRDPDGHPFEVTQLEPHGQLMQHQGKCLAARISSILRSATLVVADLRAAVGFYRDILAFKEIGTVGGATRMQVPDGTDFVELVPADRKPDAPGARFGSAVHPGGSRRRKSGRNPGGPVPIWRIPRPGAGEHHRGWKAADERHRSGRHAGHPVRVTLASTRKAPSS